MGDLVGLGGGLERAHQPAVRVGEQLLAADADARRSRPRVARRRELAGLEGVHVDLGLELVAVGWHPRPARGPPRRRPRAARRVRRACRAASGRRRSGRRSARARRRRRASPPGAARGRTPKARARGRGCGGGPRDRRRGRSCASANGRLSASVTDGLDLEPERGRRCPRGWRSIPGEMSVAVGRSISPSWARLRREVAGAGADLERVAERLAGSRPSALASFARTCSWPSSPKSIPHLES